ncbi:PKD domain-containing protein [Pseudomarimonas salicorniae]|uniref:PKD domain-containing protein n=1 Tax=Pseudomarimonas salicorniae TaxID=2933270 RepID=UPI0031BB3072
MARSEAAAIKLLDGRVLVTGGHSQSGISTASVEIYDPASGSFSPTGSLLSARGEHGIAALADGRILVAGGVRQSASGGEFLRSAEIYDPGLGAWSQTPGQMTGNESVSSPSMVSLLDGRVMVIGSQNYQMFDPASGYFSQAKPLPTRRSRAGAALLPDGRVLLAGGQDLSSAALSTADLWDPATDTWAPTASMAVARYSTRATALADGRVMISGGLNGQGKQGSAELFDPLTGAFTTTGSLAIARSGHAAVALPDGGLLVAGGYTNGSVTHSLERFDPVLEIWSSADWLNAARTRMFTATLLDSGAVLFTGGPGPLASAELYGTTGANLAPSANFSFSTSNLTASFTDASSDSDGSIASWHWTFGDGSSSSQQHPVKTYAVGGTYSVVLNVTDNAGAVGSITRQVTVSAPNAPPTANFSYATNGLTASFNDSSSDSDGSIVARQWSFGDGTNSTATNPSKTYAAGGTYSVSLTVSDNRGATHSKTVSVVVTAPACGGTALCNGVAVTGLSASTGSSTLTYTLNVPGGASNLRFVTSGGSGDADLYVKFGSAPTTTSYDCRPYQGGNAETCNMSNAQVGTYYVMLRAYSSFSGVSLTGSYSTGTGGSNVAPVANFSHSVNGLTVNFTDTSSDADGTIVSRSWSFGDGSHSNAVNPSKSYASPGTYTVALTVFDNGGAQHTRSISVIVGAGSCNGTALCNGVAVTGLSAVSGSWTATYTLVVPAGASNLKFVTSGGSGDADLYVKFGSAPTATSYDCRPYQSGNAETCTINNVQAGTYFVTLRAYSTFNGVSLQGSFTAP